MVFFVYRGYCVNYNNLPVLIETNLHYQGLNILNFSCISNVKIDSLKISKLKKNIC